VLCVCLHATRALGGGGDRDGPGDRGVVVVVHEDVLVGLPDVQQVGPLLGGGGGWCIRLGTCDGRLRNR